MLQEVVAILKGSAASEISVEYGDTKIRVKKAGVPQTVYVPVDEEPVQQAESEEAEPERPLPEVIRSTRVGIFFLREQPEREPLVAEGQVVSEGDTIAFIKSVNLMTEVVAPQAGTITAVLVEDGTAVEYGQPLFELKPVEEESGKDGVDES